VSRATLAAMVLALAATPLLAGDGENSTAKAGAAKPAAADAKPAAKAAPRTPEQLAALRAAILDGFIKPDAKSRADAGDLLVAAWPDSAPILDEALGSRNAQVRLEAVQLLRREELGDTRARIRAKVTDAAEAVRRQAIRAGRHLKWPEFESDLMKVVQNDPAWSVRQEALRGLEDRGTLKCVYIVLTAMSSEEDAQRRKAYKRVLVAILGEDHGDDAGAWTAAISDARAKADAKRK
jgi:HEAT repeat protein